MYGGIAAQPVGPREYPLEYLFQAVFVSNPRENMVRGVWKY